MSLNSRILPGIQETRKTIKAEKILRNENENISSFDRFNQLRSTHRNCISQGLTVGVDHIVGSVHEPLNGVATSH